MKNKNISPRNEKGKRHGYWEKYWSDEILWFKSFYNDGNLVGYEEKYWAGSCKRKIFYI